MEAQQTRGLPTLSAITPVRVPPPQRSPDFDDTDELSTHLAQLYKQGVMHCGKTWDSAADREKHLDKLFWQAQWALRKNAGTAVRKVAATMRTLRDTSSAGLPLCTYAWWMLRKTWQEKKSILPAQLVFNPTQMESKRWRQYYWKDCGEMSRDSYAIWPKAADELVDLLAEFATFDSFVESVDEAVYLWKSSSYDTMFRLWLKQAREQLVHIRRAAAIATKKFDIGVYVQDPVEYLGLSDLVSSKLK